MWLSCKEREHNHEVIIYLLFKLSPIIYILKILLKHKQADCDEVTNLCSFIPCFILKAWGNDTMSLYIYIFKDALSAINRCYWRLPSSCPQTFCTKRKIARSTSESIYSVVGFHHKHRFRRLHAYITWSWILSLSSTSELQHSRERWKASF